MKWAALICLSLCAAFATARPVLAQSGGQTPGRGSDAPAYRRLTTAEMRALGQRLAYIYARRNISVDSSRYRGRIMRVASRLEQAAGAPRLQIIVVRGEGLKAVSFPGGHIFLTTRLLKEIRDDDELAAVLAHEAAHCAARHTLRLIRRALGLPAHARTGFPTRQQILTGAVLNFEFPPSLRGEVQAFEREADRIALAWLKAARYRETALPILLGRIARHLSVDHFAPHRRALEERIAALDALQ